MSHPAPGPLAPADSSTAAAAAAGASTSAGATSPTSRARTAPEHDGGYRHKSARPPRPDAIRRAVALMMAGALVQALSTLTSALDRDGIRTRTATLAREFKKRTLSPHELDVATSQAYWLAVGTGVAFVVTWLVVARLVAVGRPGGRVVASLLATVYTFTFLFSGLRSLSWGSALGAVIAVIALSVVYLVWRRPVTPWLAACAARRSART